MSRAIFTILLILFLVCGCGCVETIKVIDRSMASVEASDMTGILQGCGNQPISGFTYCRMRENSSTSSHKLTFIAPKTECKNSPCRTVVINRVGANDLEFAFNKDKTTLDVHWKTILGGEETFQMYHKKFFTFRTTIRWYDTDERERETIMDGEIRLRVYNENYTPLHDAKDNKNFVWTIKITTSGRANVSRD